MSLLDDIGRGLRGETFSKGTEHVVHVEVQERSGLDGATPADVVCSCGWRKAWPLDEAGRAELFEPVATPHGAAAVEVLHADGRIDAWCMACFEARPMASMGTRVHVSCSCRCPEIWALQP